jgi:hypothetical protein
MFKDVSTEDGGAVEGSGCLTKTEREGGRRTKTSVDEASVGGQRGKQESQKDGRVGRF